jgi:MFS family permease
MGASAVLPMLPLFLRDRGISSGWIGAVIASYFLAGVLTQYVAGHVTDHVGHRPVLITGLSVYALASAGFLLSVGAAGYAALRALQGLGAGALMVAGLSLVAVVVPAGRRGRAFSRVFAAQLAGIAIGPTIGSIAGKAHIRGLFVFTCVAAVIAMVPVIVGTTSRAARAREQVDRLVISKAVVGAVLVAVCGGLVAGCYEACWSLLMTSRGAAVWQIGLSWTLFALPFVALSPVAGRLVDRFDRRLLALFAVIAGAGFAATYPFIPSPDVLIGLGSIESISVAIAIPAAQSMLADSVRPTALGRAQGFFTTAETAAIAVAAGSAGWLFAVRHWLPFVTAAIVCLGITAVLALLWRGVPGHVRDAVDGGNPDLSSGRQGPEPVADVTVKA